MRAPSGAWDSCVGSEASKGECNSNSNGNMDSGFRRDDTVWTAIG